MFIKWCGHPRPRDFTNMAGTKTISIDRAAEFLQVSRRTIYNYIRRGYLQTTRTIGGQSQRVTLESLTRVQEAARRRGERFFVVAPVADKPRMGGVESRPRAVQQPSLIHISEPTRPLSISYAV